MNDVIRVEVRGPGCCFAGVMNAIERALSQEGVEVEVTDDHPSQVGGTRVYPGTKIKLVAVHQPWGG